MCDKADASRTRQRDAQLVQSLASGTSTENSAAGMSGLSFVVFRLGTRMPQKEAAASSAVLPARKSSRCCYTNSNRSRNREIALSAAVTIVCDRLNCE